MTIYLIIALIVVWLIGAVIPVMYADSIGEKIGALLFWPFIIVYQSIKDLRE